MGKQNAQMGSYFYYHRDASAILLIKMSPWIWEPATYMNLFSKAEPNIKNALFFLFPNVL